MKRRRQALMWCMCLLLSQQSSGRARAQAQTAAAIPKLPTLPTLPSAANAAAQKDDATYFFMDLNGNYKYAFDSGQGYEGEQSGDQANEVTGHYTFYEKGVPYMVRYKAGVHGYQPVVVPADGAGNGGSGGGGGAGTGTGAAQTLAKPVLTQFMQVGNTAHANLITTNGAGRSTAPTTQTVLPSLQLSLAMPAAGAAVSNSAAQPTLRFVQDIMRAIQMQPVQISFATQKALLQQANAVNAATPSAPTTALFAPTSKAEVQEINALGQQSQTQIQQQQQQQSEASGTTAEEVPKRPYTFSYQSDQSAHTESADKSGNIVGKYSYYDAAGYHDLSYKAGDDIGFVVMGGSLSNPQEGAGATAIASSGTATGKGTGKDRETSTAAAAAAVLHANAAGGTNVPQLVVNVSQDPNISYSYTVEPMSPIETNPVEHNIRTRHGRSLRKFRRFAHW